VTAAAAAPISIIRSPETTGFRPVTNDIPAPTPKSAAIDSTADASTAASPERGQRFFTTNFGRDYASCATCHGAVPTKAGKDAATEKPIGAMAPAFNPARFTDKAKVENLFRLNCKDVVGRECTAAEKADVLGWLLSLKP